jgi:exoribonuclease II
MKYALLEEAGELKTGTMLSEAESSYQIELDTGRRVKVKAQQVYLRFEQPESRALLPQALALAESMELDFLWECAPKEEFGFAAFAEDYYGGKPSSVQSAALLIKLQSAPIYFQRRGKGQFLPAPIETIRMALVAVEKRKALEAQVNDWAGQLVAGVLPETIGQQALRLITRPDKMSLEFKAFDKALQELKTTPEKLLLKLGAFSSAHAIHHARFELDLFPKGLTFPAHLIHRDAEKSPKSEASAAGQSAPAGAGKSKSDQGSSVKGNGLSSLGGLAGLGQLAGLAQLKQLVKGPEKALELSKALPFSIDDSSTTEIDDCLSVQTLADGRYRVGVHIAAPACTIEHDSPLDKAARERMSTVYMPGEKITMMPTEVVARYSLDAGREVPALSIYVDLDEAGQAVVASESRLELIKVWANLRHDQLDSLVNEEALDSPASAAGQALESLPQASALRVLWKLTLAQCLEREKIRGKPEARFRTDFSFYVENDFVRIIQRRRDAPLDRIVAELMILANSRWGKLLAEHKTAGLYRSQQGGRVRMSTHALPHEGLGVAQYMWCTSPLRRYVDLVNQRQLVAVLREQPAPYGARDPALFAILSGFDARYGAYSDIQDRMERYWCLRWLEQEAAKPEAPRRNFEAVCVREETVRLAEAPLYFRITGLHAMAPGRRFEVEIVETDLLELTVHGRFVKLLQGEVVVEEAEEEISTEIIAEDATDLAASDATLGEEAVSPSAQGVDASGNEMGGDMGNDTLSARAAVAAQSPLDASRLAEGTSP